MRIKIIDLLNKIANGEEVPEKIKFNDYEYLYHDKEHGYCRHYYDNTYITLNTDYCLFNILNDEVEILEEKKLPEKLEEIGKIGYDLGYIDYKNIEVLKTWLNSDMQVIFNELDLIVKNQNQLIDYLEIKEKGE